MERHIYMGLEQHYKYADGDIKYLQYRNLCVKQLCQMGLYLVRQQCQCMYAAVLEEQPDWPCNVLGKQL